jgi:hypothetical protein
VELLSPIDEFSEKEECREGNDFLLPALPLSIVSRIL